MGYTHYWKATAPLSDSRRETVFKGLTLILEAAIKSGISIGDGLGETTAYEITSEFIRFNGIGEAGYETFNVEFNQATAFDFCKTGRKPYDMVVVACLVFIDSQWSDFSWSSDGTDSELLPGIEFLKSVLSIPD